MMYLCEGMCMCPEFGNLTFNGQLGTSLYVVPKKNETFNVTTNPDLFSFNQMSSYFMTRKFVIDDYLAQKPIPWVVSFDQQYTMMTKKFNIETYLDDPLSLLKAIKTSATDVQNQVWNKNRLIDISFMAGAEPDDSFSQIDTTMTEMNPNIMSLNCGPSCYNMFLNHTEDDGL